MEDGVEDKRGATPPLNCKHDLTQTLEFWIATSGAKRSPNISGRKFPVFQDSGMQLKTSQCNIRHSIA
jgi:hypothetical protein